jgi:hypothetical protein
MPKLSDSLRRAVNESNVTRYAIAKGAGLPYAVVHYFANGERDLKLSSADKLADYFGLVLTDATKRPKPKRKPQR